MGKLNSEEGPKTKCYCFTENLESKLYRKFLVEWGKVWKDAPDDDQKDDEVKGTHQNIGCDMIHEVRESPIFVSTNK